MTHVTHYAYVPAHFGGTLPDDPLIAAQTAAQIAVTLARHAEPVALVLDGGRLAAPVRIVGRAFEAGDIARRLWTLVDAVRGVRLTACRLEAADEGGGALTVIAAGLPLKPGQGYNLSLEQPPGTAAVLRAGGLAQGTRVLTQGGKRPVEEIRVGDMVWTGTGAFRPVLWHGVQSLPARGLAAPLRLPRGLLGLTEDLRVAGSQDIRIETDAGQVLVPAAAFERAGRATREFGTAVQWHQLLMADHAVILAAGLAVATVFAPDRLADGIPEGWPEAGVAQEAPVLPRLTEAEAQRWIA